MSARLSSQLSPRELKETFQLRGVRVGLPPRFNIAPGEEVPVVTNTGERYLDGFRWGLVPFWSRDPSLGHRHAHARVEALGLRPAFRVAARKRCLVLADGFYEWRWEGHHRQPYYVQRRDGEAFAIAGIWDTWRSVEGLVLRTCAIVTTGANHSLRALTDRMPALLGAHLYDAWLSPKVTSLDLWRQLLLPAPDKTFEAFPVSRYVEAPEHEGPQCIAPLLPGNGFGDDALHPELPQPEA